MFCICFVYIICYFSCFVQNLIVFCLLKCLQNTFLFKKTSNIILLSLVLIVLIIFKININCYYCRLIRERLEASISENPKDLKPLGTLGTLEELNEISEEEMATLIQWSDLIIFDYLTGNYDRVAGIMVKK